MPATHRSAAHGRDADFCVGVLVIIVVGGRVEVAVSGTVVVGGTVVMTVVATTVSSVRLPGWSV